MNRSIDADALIKAIPETRVDIFENCRNCSLLEKVDVISIIHNLPTAEKHGHWIDIDSESYTWRVRCSECSHERSMMSTQGRYPKYCEECGAKMGDEDETF